MTGFARQSAETAAGTLTWELRAVNHRYLDVQFRLPEELRPKESVFKQQVSDALKRGKVECTLHLNRDGAVQAEMELNANLIALISKRITEISKTVPQAVPPAAVDILRWPGVIVESEIDAEPLYEAANEVLQQGLAALKAMRASEGERITQMLTARCDDIAALGATVRERMPEVLASAHAKQREPIERLDVEADPSRLEVELALWHRLERCVTRTVA